MHPKGCDAVLDLVGNGTILDSLTAVWRGGRVCLAGFLGGLAPMLSVNPLLQMPSGVQFSFFGSFVFGSPEFPLSDIPLQDIVDRVTSGDYKAKPVRVFRFEEIQEAHRVMESNQAGGKLVVKLENVSGASPLYALPHPPDRNVTFLSRLELLRISNL